MSNNTAGSLYLAGGSPVGLQATDGSAVQVGSGLSMSSGSLVATGTTTVSGGSSSGTTTKLYTITIYNGGAQGGSGGSIITTPYFFFLKAKLAGTIKDVSFALQSADGANFGGTVQVLAAASGASGAAVPVVFSGASNPLPVSNGEGGTTNQAGYLGSGIAPLTYTASSANTYAAGDMVQCTFSAVGGTFQCMTVQLGVVE